MAPFSAAGDGPEQPAGSSERALADMLAIAAAIADARDLPGLLDQILSKSRHLTCSDAGSIYLLEHESRHRAAHGPAPPPRLRFTVFQNDSLSAAVPRRKPQGDVLPIDATSLAGWAALSGEVLNIPDVRQLPPESPCRFDASIDQRLGYATVSMLVVPLRTNSGRVVGVMQLINRKRQADQRITPSTPRQELDRYDAEDQHLIEALANLAAVCVERTQLLDEQQLQIDSIISLLANAIDARSRHTGRHCARVPELALLLAGAAEAVQEGPLAGFRFGDEEERREFRTAAWLHDCGKITTPDAVVEKATKLHAFVNRIHEIRTRFEVLLRDARISLLEGLLAGGDRDALQRRHDERQAELQREFTFLARCNLGSEQGLTGEERERLQRLAGWRWQRHFDDRLGLGWEELERLPPDPAPLPCTEFLLADRPEHRIPRPAERIPDPSWGFTLEVPDDVANLGELHNLSVERGTLTPEERYTIREHMVHTITMLESVAFPSRMSRVAEYAGAHHETLDGRGYPRGLRAQQLSIPARILAIADIFEALTASDRPYKRAMPVSQALRILADFRDRRCVDPDLVDLFLRSGTWRTYAETFLKPEQLDISQAEAERLTGNPLKPAG